MQKIGMSARHTSSRTTTTTTARPWTASEYHYYNHYPTSSDFDPSGAGILMSSTHANTSSPYVSSIDPSVMAYHPTSAYYQNMSPVYHPTQWKFSPFTTAMNMALPSQYSSSSYAKTAASAFDCAANATAAELAATGLLAAYNTYDTSSRKR